jgi:choline-glycine betaine transporter
MAQAGKDAEMERLVAVMKKCWHFEIKGVVIMNPVVFIVSVVLIWALVIACIASPDHMLRAFNSAAFKWIPEVWTWLYIISQNIWIILLVYILAVPKYANIKLGKDDEEPEYSFATWFSMLFSAGVAVGLFYYSVAEPVYHYMGSAYFTKGARGYGSQDEDSMIGLAVTWYHWGLHGWIPYTTMGAVIGIMAYRRDFPMTIRYCLWPLLGENCYGWLGDLIDILSIITTIAGVCTSLGLGAKQINQGMQRLDHGFYRGVNYAIPNDAKFANPYCGSPGELPCLPGQESVGIQINLGWQIGIIATVTCLATLSVVSGLNRGIVNLSRFNFTLGLGLCLAVLFLGETYYILDLITQTFGYYCWIILKMAFHCDAFERLGSKAFGLGGAPDGVAGSPSWLGGWTIFYWGWWISWGPFVGTFLAKISRGRTLRQFILGTLFIPTIFSFFWFGVFGAEGIRMQRQAQGSNVCANAGGSQVANCMRPADTSASVSTKKCGLYSQSWSDTFKKSNNIGWTPSCVLDPTYHGGYGQCKEEAWTRWVEFGDKCVETTSWIKVPCGSTVDPTAAPSTWSQNNYGYCNDKVRPDMNGTMYNKYPSARRPDCFVPAQDGIVCLHSAGFTDILFDQLSSYGPRGFSDLLSVWALMALVLYFITSSDSGSLVTDMISANGHPEPPIPQRIFWSLTEGATAAALLAAGRNIPNQNANLQALQSASLIAGLPYTFILFWTSQSLYLLCREESGELSKDRLGFPSFVFSMKMPVNLILNTFVPGIPLGQIIDKVKGYPFSDYALVVWTALFQIAYVISIIFVFCGFALYQWMMIGMSCYIGYGCFVGFLRCSVRTKYKIMHGDLLSDCLLAVFLPMFTVTQMQELVLHFPDAEKYIGADKLQAKTGNGKDASI